MKGIFLKDLLLVCNKRDDGMSARFDKFMKKVCLADGLFFVILFYDVY